MSRGEAKEGDVMIRREGEMERTRKRHQNREERKRKRSRRNVFERNETDWNDAEWGGAGQVAPSLSPLSLTASPFVSYFFFIPLPLLLLLSFHIFSLSFSACECSPLLSPFDSPCSSTNLDTPKSSSCTTIPCGES